MEIHSNHMPLFKQNKSFYTQNIRKYTFFSFNTKNKCIFWTVTRFFHNLKIMVECTVRSSDTWTNIRRSISGIPLEFKFFIITIRKTIVKRIVAADYVVQGLFTDYLRLIAIFFHPESLTNPFYVNPVIYNVAQNVTFLFFPYAKRFRTLSNKSHIFLWKFQANKFSYYKQNTV